MTYKQIWINLTKLLILILKHVKNIKSSTKDMAITINFLFKLSFDAINPMKSHNIFNIHHFPNQ